MAKRSAPSAPGARTAGNVRRATRRVESSDISKASTAQLMAMRRLSRPAGKRQQLVVVEIDAPVLEGLRREARRRRIGYQTLINEVLAEHVRNEVA
jgi:uncharacterized protein (DUF4415 family)